MQLREIHRQFVIGCSGIAQEKWEGKFFCTCSPMHGYCVINFNDHFRNENDNFAKITNLEFQELMKDNLMKNKKKKEKQRENSVEPAVNIQHFSTDSQENLDIQSNVVLSTQSYGSRESEDDIVPLTGDTVLLTCDVPKCESGTDSDDDILSNIQEIHCCF